ncbi:acyl-CoA dehydrogenase family protein [Paracoccus sp. MA]|uniref:acyl-CoA dehydrogenase family protein n=1 Tax=Paracoccus sp. MA TaxID=2895796 RepID=UPI001E441DCF|nr:acyl-CoA dehydrogenase family protein [Paracoccus sp. MA]UFM64131.1 acyl-CoA dehydrogenase family protein [Paracoccus sp. MA]
MTPFAAPVDDILFSLEHVAEAGRLPGWDEDLVREIVTQFARFAEAEVAPADEAADLQGCRIEDGRVRMPAGLVAAYRGFADQGWPALTLPEAAGGQGMPAPVAGAVTEILAGASHAFQMITGLVAGAARTITRFGTDDQKALWLPRLASGDWLATMALTEAGAGSDLSGIRCRAYRDGEGWRIEGEKIFISGGDHDLTPRILHLVLARTGDAASGVKGLSLFLVPSHDDDGKPLPVSVTRIEEKLGLHGSPTCQMLFDNVPAELLAAEGDGLTAMFTMMNHARLDVALQGVAHAARASHIARAYAATRRQGRVGGAPAMLEAHPDVQRMLDDADALAIGGRALTYRALVELELSERPGLVDILTPVCKFACTEAGVAAANLAIQVMGGYGYLREYRVEQALRDARITTIYEGANGIHALALATRLLKQADGAAARAFAEFLDPLPETRAIWETACKRMQAAPDPAGAAHAFMLLTIEAAMAAVWQRLNEVAELAPNPARLTHLCARQTALHPIRLRHQADLVALALAGMPQQGSAQR